MANFDGTSANETFTGGNGNETINGAGGDDTLGGGGGIDQVDGGSGAGDRLVMAGPQSAYAVTLVDGTHTRLVNAGTGEDVTFTNTEFVQFSDVLRTALEVRNITSNAAPAFSPSPAGVSFSGQAGAFDGGGKVLLQPDGKILVVGSIANGQASPSPSVPFAEDLMVTRFNADGTLDATFGGDGRVTTSAFGTHAQATDAVLQADGKLVVTALVWKSGSFFEFGVARYNTDGSLDTSFDGDGTLIDALDIRNDQSPRGAAAARRQDRRWAATRRPARPAHRQHLPRLRPGALQRRRHAGTPPSTATATPTARSSRRSAALPTRSSRWS